MPINPALLVSAPMLQDYFVDKDTGLPLVQGIVTCYQDNSRTTLKNWYYQTGTPGNYTYLALPNPMQLSAVGTIVDFNGNDTIPFFYPYSELDNSTVQTYYITVQDMNGELQFVRANFPFVPNQTNSVSTTTNYAFNNSFWRNIGTLNLSPGSPLTKTTNVTGITLFYEIVAPGNHDGFTMPDIEYIKSANNSTETITFQTFSDGTAPLVGDITPEYFLRHNCSAPGADGDKFYQIPISLHINQLEGQQAALTIQAISNTGNSTDIITPSIFQFNGTGTVQASPVLLQPIELTRTWTKYVRNFTFPSTAGAPISPGDDAWYLILSVPSSVQFDLSFTLPSIYLNQTNLPTNNFTTYDQVDSIINSPRTGDVRVSLNAFYPYGWVPMNDGTIGNASSNATSRSNTDTWQLFYLLWNNFNSYSQFNGASLVNLVPIYDSLGSPSTYGSSAINDFNANKQLSLTKMMGKVLLGTVDINSLLTPYKQTATSSSSSGLLINISDGSSLYRGQIVTFTTNTGGSLPDGIVAGQIYFVANPNLAGPGFFRVSNTFDNAMAGNFLPWSSNGSNFNAVFDITGTNTGQFAHTQLEGELAAHYHNGSFITGYTVSAAGAHLAASTIIAGGPINFPLNAPGNANGAIAIDGANAPFNVTQPGSFSNFYIKL